MHPRDAKLASQIRNAAHSVPSNIAEGYGYREKENDFKRFLRIAMGRRTRWLQDWIRRGCQVTLIRRQTMLWQRNGQW
ncbi:MAG: four helix bundle protein [Chloroflexi bacterium]|nr:four helix bundle protein [Chloroflexota bacterium]